MTKEELIKFLEPFSSDIEIEIIPKYEFNGKHPARIKNLINSLPKDEDSSVSTNEAQIEDCICMTCTSRDNNDNCNICNKGDMYVMQSD